MPYTVFGLPTHVLIVHLAVVGIPTACLATLAIAIRPAWRRRFGYWAAGLAVVMVPVTYLTQVAGEQLYTTTSTTRTARPRSTRSSAAPSCGSSWRWRSCPSPWCSPRR